MAVQCTLVDILISRLLKWTRNKNLLSPSGSTVEGLNHDYVLQALNAGKQNIQVAVARAKHKAFAGFVTAQITALAREQDIPESLINSDRIIRVDYSATNDDNKFYRLAPIDPSQWGYCEGTPATYFTTDGKIVLSPNPSSGYLRYLGQIKDDRLDPRRGTVASVALDGSNLNTITLASDSYRNSINNTALEEAEYVCFSNYAGVVAQYDISVTGFDSSSRVLTCRSGQADPTTIVPGLYVTAGKRTSTHSKLKIEFESYYLQWAQYRILNHDASDQAIDDVPVLQTLRENLIESYADGADLEEIIAFGNFLGSW